MRHVICFALGIAILCFSGCNQEASQTKSLLLTVEGDALTKATIENMIKQNPTIQIPRSKIDSSDITTEYSLQIVEPDPSKNYSILRVQPDPDAEYSIMIYDPKTQRPPTNIDPKTLDAILRDLEKRKEELKNK